MIDNKLKTFIVVAEIGSYTKAGNILNFTQPAITQQMKCLEEYYDVSLFKKNGRQITLTEEGKLLLKTAKEIESKSLGLAKLLKNKGAIIKRYDIGATLTIGEYVLPRILGEYSRKNISIETIMHVYNSEIVLNKIITGEFDLGVVEGLFDKKKFSYKKLKDDEMILVASSSNLMGKKQSIKMEEIVNGGGLILREKGSGTRTIFENKLIELGFNKSDVKVFMEVGSIGAIKSLVKANLGYTIISREAVKFELENGYLIEIPIENVKIYREFNFVYLENGPTEFIEDFIDFYHSV